MGTRPGGPGGATPNRPKTAPASRPYQPFSPISEWKIGEQSDLLLVHLPGFLKQDIKVTTETRNILRVRGENLVAGNKWSRFQEDYQIPEKCNIRGIRAKFEGGILTITMPWKSTTTTHEKPKTTTHEKPKTTTHEKPKTTTPPTPTLPPQEATYNKPSSDQTTKDPPIPSQAAPSTSDKKMPETSTFETRDTPKATNTSNYAADKQMEELTKLEPISPSPQNVTKDKDATAKEATSETKKQAKIYDPNTMEKMVGKEKIGDEVFEKKDGEVAKEDVREVMEKIVDKRDENRSGFERNSLEDYKELVKRLARGMNEERELMVNMGVAALVIVALGAYITYTFVSSGKSAKN